jgi:TonB family protein
MTVVGPEDIRRAALDLAIERGLAGDPQGFPEGGDLATFVNRGLLAREDAQLLMTEAEIVLTGRFPEFGDQETAVAGAPAGTLQGSSGLYPWKDLSRYRPEVYLGEGGMGRVFRVLDTRLNRRVALKFFRHHSSLSASAFLREVQTQARIDHPNVARVFEAGEHEGIAFLSVQMIQGPTLAQAAGGLSHREKVEAIRQAALGIHAAHILGIVHRDLKPGNIMLEPDGKGGWKSLVVDFGLARDLTEAPSRTTTVMGTPAYMSPEQIEGPAVLIGPHSDVYSLGVTLYEMLAGCLPFSGPSQAELLRCILEGEPPRLRAMDPTLSRDLEAIIQHCMERDVLKRYDSALEFAEDLGRFLAGSPVSVKPVSPLSRQLRRFRKNPLPVASAAVILVLGGGWATYALSTRARERAMGERMQAQVADLARINHELQGLRSAQAEERSRAVALERKVAMAATAAERQDAEGRLKASLARERELAVQVDEAQRKARNEAPVPPKPTKPTEAASPSPAREAVEPSNPVAKPPDPTFIPPQVVKQASAAYPSRALTNPMNPHRNRETSVLVLVQVDSSGKATAAKVLEGYPGPWGYDEAALQAVSLSTYAPAQRGGRDVAGSLEVRVRFLPPKR